MMGKAKRPAGTSLSKRESLSDDEFLNGMRQRLTATMARASANPDFTEENRKALPGVLARLLAHVADHEDFHSLRYDGQGFPVDEDCEPVMPPSKADQVVLIEVILCAAPDKFHRKPDGRWVVMSRA